MCGRGRGSTLSVWLLIWLGDVRVKLFLAFTAGLAVMAMLFFVVMPRHLPLIATHNGRTVYCFLGRRGCWPISEKDRDAILRERARNYRP
jgi:hypothetical protein